MASAANRLLHAAQQNSELEFGRNSGRLALTVTDLQYVLEGEAQLFSASDISLSSKLAGEGGLSAPDLMVVHHVTCPPRQRCPMELQAFPPWQIRLTEFLSVHPFHRLACISTSLVMMAPGPCGRVFCAI